MKKEKSARNHFLIGIEGLLFFISLVAYIYTRLDPIFRQTVPYTYDQGRDFLKALDIVKNHNLTFIGPTTGINGLFHGAWWYYFLSAPYVLFSARPIGFYYAIFMVVALSTLLFAYFLGRKLNNTVALLFFIVIAFSPYFIPTAFQASNNFMVPPFILLLLFSIYKTFEKYEYKYIFLTSLALGFIFEFEVAFGLFIIPSAIISFLFFVKNKRLFTVKNVLFFLAGFIIPLLPRLLFELKNNFLQTKTIIGFFIKPSATNPTPFSTAFHDRALMFWNYYKSMFLEQQYLPIIVLLLTIVCVAYGYRKLTEDKKYTFIYVSLLTTFLFLSSLLYRNNFFWANYYEGLPYFFLYLTVIAVYAALLKGRQGTIVLLILISLYLVSGLITVYRYAISPKENNEGLRRTVMAIKYVVEQSDKERYCLKEYTPPVITHTYHYIEEYNELANIAKKPQTEYVNKQCWYIIEYDPYAFRVEKWRQENIPPHAKKIKEHSIGKEISIELWQQAN